MAVMVELSEQILQPGGLNCHSLTPRVPATFHFAAVKRRGVGTPAYWIDTSRMRVGKLTMAATVLAKSIRVEKRAFRVAARIVFLESARDVFHQWRRRSSYALAILNLRANDEHAVNDVF